MPQSKTKTIAEFGDFQTPTLLAQRVCALLDEIGIKAASIVEPTCGHGAFLFAAADQWPSAKTIIGIEVNAGHLAAATDRAAARDDHARIHLSRADFFNTNWRNIFADVPDPLLVIGNPPWVTNAHVSALGGSNVPLKSNFQGHNGFDAVTGKANFDISEWMLVQLIQSVHGRDAVLAMLVKTVVARKVLRHCWKMGLSIDTADLFQIDAMTHFGAAVDASLLVIRFGYGAVEATANVYAQLSRAISPVARIGIAGDTLIADIDAFNLTKHLAGPGTLAWRSGVKHDCSKVMELHECEDVLRNGLGELVDIEPDHLYPMLKTSEVANGKVQHPKRWMIVPQRRIGDSTAEIEDRAPKTWRYLNSHKGLLAKRGSSIYHGKPQFSIFGIGDYSFAPWKVAISGMYKKLQFVKVGTHRDKPIMLDDVTNFLPCPSENAADLLIMMLESTRSREFFRSYIFWDAKRPVTVELLQRLDLHALANELGVLTEFEDGFGSRRGSRRGRTTVHTPTLWESPAS